MKKYIAFFVLGFTLYSSASAQVSLGVKAGGAITSLPGDYNNDTKNGFYGGVTGELPVGKKFSIAAELVYSLQGNKQRIMFAEWAPNDSYYATGKKENMNLSYVNLPLLVKYQVIKNIFIETGLQPGLLVNARVKTSQGSGDIKDNYESFDLSWPVGIGFKLRNGLGANLRYNTGLTNVYKGNQWEPKNRVVQLGLFYNFKKN
jgi:hypothetical protein